RTVRRTAASRIADARRRVPLGRIRPAGAPVQSRLESRHLPLVPHSTPRTGLPAPAHGRRIRAARRAQRRTGRAQAAGGIPLRNDRSLNKPRLAVWALACPRLSP